MTVLEREGRKWNFRKVPSKKSKKTANTPLARLLRSCTARKKEKRRGHNESKNEVRENMEERKKRSD